MIVVHHLNNSRSQRILWMLEELGLDYEIKHYQRDRETMLAPQSLKEIHPLGKSPVISDGDIVVAESGAIIEYLAQTYGRGLLIPPPESAEYRQYIYWLHFSEGSLMPPLLLKIVFDKINTSPMPFFIKPVARGISTKVMTSFVNPNIDNNFAYIDDYLAGHEWFAGDSLSGADIQMSFPLEASAARGVIGEKYPHIADYVSRFQARPAYQKALEAGGEYDYSM
jgi:glutathione S-transferase